MIKSLDSSTYKLHCILHKIQLISLYNINDFLIINFTLVLIRIVTKLIFFVTYRVL